MFSHKHKTQNSPTQKPEIIFIMGGPGSGKGTHSKLLSQKNAYQHISTGAIYRNFIHTNNNNTIGIEEIEATIARGELLSDQMTLSFLISEIDKHPNAKGFLIDGYPRTMQQLALFEKEIGAYHKVIYFSLSEIEMNKRLLTRKSGQYRADDKPETIATRLKIYNEKTKPVITYLQEKMSDKFITIDTSGEISQVEKNLTDALQQNQKPTHTNSLLNSSYRPTYSI